MFNVIELRKHFCFPAEESLCIGRCVAHLYCWNNCNKNCTDSGHEISAQRDASGTSDQRRKESSGEGKAKQGNAETKNIKARKI